MRNLLHPMSASAWLDAPHRDALWFLSGLWLPFLFLVLPTPVLHSLMIPLTLGLWIAHRLSSLYLALCLPEYRPLIQARRHYFFGVPLLLLLGFGAFVFCPKSLLPLSRMERFLALAMADYGFSLYHFAMQHYGVLALYRSRPGCGRATPALKRRERWLCLTVSGLFSLILEACSGELRFGPLGLPALLPPGWPLQTLKGLLTMGVVLIWVLTLRDYRRQAQSPGSLLYFSGLCWMSLCAFYLAPLLYFSLVQLQHWLVSLGLARLMSRNSQPQPLQGWYRFWRRWHGGRQGALPILLLLSLLLTPLLEADHFIVSGFDPAALTVPGLLEGLARSEAIWLWILGTLAFFSACVHYLYDRGIFRLSDPQTRSVTLYLLRSPHEWP
jgi:hypothetical protein